MEQHEKKIDPSVKALWQEFVTEHPEYKGYSLPPSYYFCDNAHDADECATLVSKGIKQATATSLWWFETHNEPLPKIGDLAIVTDWKGRASSIIKTTKVVPTKFKDVDAQFARIEGEGDKSLEYWRRVHINYYTREMEMQGAQFDENMVILCEHFETIFTKESHDLL